MLSQFFILSSRGDTLIFRDYRGDVVKGTAEIFYRKLKGLKADEPPTFNIEGVNFLFIKKNDLYFVCTTKFNVSPAMVLGLLGRISSVCKDYCGVLNEDSIRTNVALVYELLDEMLDFGYIQNTSTEALKPYIQNETELVEPITDDAWHLSGGNVFGTDQIIMPSNAANRPVIDHKGAPRRGKSEVFVDLLERLTVLIGPNGSLLKSEINGKITMRKFLIGSPSVTIGLNEDLVVNKASSESFGSGLRLDACNFHESVNSDEFEKYRMVSLNPPDGEFTVMSYKVSNNSIPLPFTVATSINEPQIGETLEVLLTLRCRVPSNIYATNITVALPVPRTTQSISHDSGVSGQSFEYKQSEKRICWKIRKMFGQQECTAKFKIKLNDKGRSAKMEIRHINMEFEIQMFSSSGLQIKYLKISEESSRCSPFRWIRLITHSDSYVIRL